MYNVYVYTYIALHTRVLNSIETFEWNFMEAIAIENIVIGVISL